MSDYTFNMGPLRSAIHIQLHTHNATRLWTGRRATENGPAPIIGMPRFIEILNQIRIAAEHNDPYADLWMLRMEEKLVQSRKLMQVMLDQAKGMFSELPEGIDIENCFNVQPARFPLFINTPLAYQGVYLLTDFDQLARQLLLASHIAVISRREMHDRLNNGATVIRSAFGLAQKYHGSGLTRQDIIDDTPQARAAIERLGPLPEAILSGKLRSSFSSPLPSKTENPGVADDE
ncbi:PFL_4669 family integrating conjugative element protein [Citrobacter freundii]|uniref:PFL_4669 family integrating conjugative element protein n=1 Tax=Citrobacter freundii TaxID=546 RepID=UPI001BCF70D7|nr:TIGR03761 family integrating conjugative element protein [Citrobacter freundii]HEM7416297.1 TIGR03761 family integrating conjugative element protein [Citrobacter youngae]MCT4725593.1 TIGR03761 family integrating conjugative element protein [Citrobacter freundii]MCT4747864.1 TIGR03761 family integrating conjugative element protein [Citrobacter freundii]MDT7124551.1 TIGR03761 family integrating conjugative element protein [Citrobacter freundii]MDT7141831.1 TIGR03761 family integrating conjuga